ncbi:MAG TPA: DNA polymerase III subunit gamma and tau [Mycobacteriales bacterium]|jgi:DNA polymerase-3 subunit gamma/tau|nr:DNA polymerase III subunit gamma and tau [Mycobacteriales bacterium]
MSLALYRKYRPGTFADVFGQEHVTEPICQALDSGRIHHAYLFSGPRGCGKTSSARILARSLNCEKGPTSTPCGECDSCVALAPMGPGSLDVIEIDAASHGLVDDARDLRERAFFAPVSSRFKIYVIDEAHMITTAAFNALLKVVEEPPPHVKFIFATTEPDKVLVTIKSRTFHYRFRLIPPQVMREHLAEICEAEGITIDPLVLPLIVRAGAGCARDAQSILDQLASGSGNSGISYDGALALLGYTDAALLDEVVDAFAAGDGASVFRAVDRVLEAGLEPRRFAQDLLERFRDLLVLDAVPDAGDTGLLDAPADELERMRSQAARYGRPSLSRAADVMAVALVDMRGTTSPRLVLELACARVLLPGATSDTAALLARLDRLEARLSATGGAAASVATPPPPETAVEGAAAEPSPPVAKPAPGGPGEAAVEPADEAAQPQAAAPEAAQPPPAAAESTAAASGGSAAGGFDVTALNRLWSSVLDAVKQRSRTANALMLSSQIESLVDRTLTLSFPTPTLATRFANDVSAFVVEALKEVVGLDLVLVAVSAGAAPQPARTSASASSPSVSSPSGAASQRANEPEPDEFDPSSESDAPTPEDATDSALALLKKDLGAQVIGEIDQS